MFSFLSKEDPPLQLYGKLPLAKDYLRIGCAEGAGRRLREWMDRSFSSAESSAPALGHPMRFLWPDGGNALLGTLWPSSDAGGLRPFPFALFVERKGKVLWVELEQGMRALGGWFRALDGLRERALGLADGAELLAFLRGKKVGASAEETAVERLGYERWAASLFPDGPAGVEAFLAGVVRDEGGRRGPLVLPMTAGLPLEPQVDAWLGVLRALDRLTKKGATTLFFSCAGEGTSGLQPRLVLLPREPAPGESAWLGVPVPSSGGGDTERDSSAANSDSGPTLAQSLCGTLALVRSRAVRA